MAKNNEDFFKSKNNWSQIKDKLLRCYLVPYFQKIILNGKPICYIDCFAGKGKFEDGNPGSPVIALEARKSCLKKTTCQDASNKIEICFIELNHAHELSENVASYNDLNGRPVVISGKYEDNIENLLRSKKGCNVFLYIDPYGIKALDSELLRKFDAYGLHSLEILINFNSFGFFRDACRVLGVNYSNDDALQNLEDLVEYAPTDVNVSLQSERMLTNIAGGEYWKDIVFDYRNGKIDGFEAEKILSSKYKTKLKENYNYVLDMPIRLKPKQRPKYRMFHICQHEDGCFLMAQNMQKRKDELFIRIQQKGQLSFMGLFDNTSISAENELVSTKEIKRLLLNQISNLRGDTRINKLLAAFMSEHGLICDFNMIYALLGELEQSNIIDIVRTPSITKHGVKSNFWTECKDKKIMIRAKIE